MQANGAAGRKSKCVQKTPGLPASDLESNPKGEVVTTQHGTVCRSVAAEQIGLTLVSLPYTKVFGAPGDHGEEKNEQLDSNLQALEKATSFLEAS